MKLIKKIKEEIIWKYLSRMEIFERSSASVKIGQIQLFNYYRFLIARNEGIPPLKETGFRIFSQFEEDGYLLFIFALIGVKNKIFVDIGAGDGINSNCANLAINLGWHGLFIDGNEKRIKRGIDFYSIHSDTSLYPPKFVNAMVNKENINQTIQDAGFSGEIDFLSIDIDGNDYWVWDALEIIQPRVVMIETHIEFGLNNIVVPYDAKYVFPGKHPIYHGASPVAIEKLANKKGYRLVGSNRFGFNTIYVINKEGKEKYLPTQSVQELLIHPRIKERVKLFDEIKSWEYISG